jgi:large subunit ribosomal protein L15
MPLQRRLPKRGFTNIFKKEFQIVNLSDLSRTYPQVTGSVEEMITPALMKEKGLIKKIHVPVKILGDGEFTLTITIQANAFSQKAKEKIEAAGGKIKVMK